MLLREPPLRTVSSFLEDSSNAPSLVRLAEPFWTGQAYVRLLVHAVQLHTLLERETVGSGTTPQLDEICAARPRVGELLDALFADAALIRPGIETPVPLLDETGLSAMCPLVAHYLGDPDKLYRSDDVPVVREYVEHVGALNQLLQITMQLRDDVTSGRHKYAAHKIALVYHAINNSKLAREVCGYARASSTHSPSPPPPTFDDAAPGGTQTHSDFSPFAHTPPAQVLRKRIEEHFEDVKEATETQEAPVLPPELVTWLVELCDEVATLVREPAPSLRNKLAPVSRYLNTMRSS
jgi:hypothetical protein